eukprot:403348123
MCQIFNIQSGITVQDKPAALKQQEIDSLMRQQQAQQYGGVPLTQKQQEDLSSLFTQRNLNLPKQLGNPNSNQTQMQSQAQLPYYQQQNQNASYQGFVPDQSANFNQQPGSMSLDPADQFMKKALDTALKGDIVRDIYPTLNYFRTEERITDKKVFRSFDNLSKEDALHVFKEALRESGVTASWKWEDANRVVMNDPRVKALKTISERKQAFNDYINEIKTKERNDARNRRQQQKEGFLELLGETKNLNSLSKFYIAAKQFQSDSRFKSVEEKDREEIFQDYIDEIMTKEREEKREQGEKIVEKLKEHFTKLNIPGSAKWKELITNLADDQLFKSADTLEQITAFEEYIKAIERQEFQTKKFEKRRQERKNRENFVKLLEEKLQSRELTHRSKWKNFVKEFKDDQRYTNLVGQSGSTAHELFEDALNEEKELLRIHKPSFKSLIKGRGIRFASNVEFQAFDEILRQYSEYEKLDKKVKVTLHEYYLYKVKQKESEKAKKLTKTLRNFEKYLKNIVNLQKSEVYQDYLPWIEKEGEFSVLTEEIKQKSFTEVVQFMKDEILNKSKKRSRSRGKQTNRDSSVESGELKLPSQTARHTQNAQSKQHR